MNYKERLNKYIIAKCKILGRDYTLKGVESNIANLGVKINEKLIIDKMEWVYPNIDIVNWDHWDGQNSDKSTFNLDIKNSIFYNKNDIIIVNKPESYPSIPSFGWEKTNIEYLINQLYPEKTNFKIFQPLSKESSGLMIGTCSGALLNNFKLQFSKNTLQKEYFALVNGVLEENIISTHWQIGDLERGVNTEKIFLILENAKNYVKKHYEKFNLRYYSYLEIDSERDTSLANIKKCKTIIKPVFVCTRKNQTLVKITNLSEKKDQMELLLKMLGFPIVGEEKYNQMTSILDYDSNLPDYKIIKRRAKFYEYYKEKRVEETENTVEMEKFLPLVAVVEKTELEFELIIKKYFNPATNMYLICNKITLQLNSGPVVAMLNLD